jgi:Trp operon repressor
MVNVSKKRLPEKQLTELVTQLTEVLGRLSTRQAHCFVNEFLGREEKEVLAKRLAIVVLIDRHHSLYSIARKLAVSPTTVGKLYDRYERKEFVQTLSALKKNKRDYVAFLDTLDSFLHLGGLLPHYGDNREVWKRINRQLGR